MKKLITIALVACFLVPAFAFAAQQNADIKETNTDEVLISFIGEENGVAFYDVVIDDGFDWNNASFYDQGDFARLALGKCRADAKEQGFANLSVMGMLSSGFPGFVWDGGNEIRLKVYDSEFRVTEYPYLLSELP